MTQQRGTINEHTIQSEYLNQSITFMVYLPYNYSDLYTYPLVIAQDGRDYFQLGRINKVADKLISENEIEDVIIAGIPYENPQVRWGKYHPDGSLHNAYIHFLVYEFLPYMKKHFAIDDLAGSRTLIGDSLGGTISLLTALKYPHTFSNVIMQSPYVDDRIIRNVQEANMAGFSIYHVIGKQETAVKTTKGEIRDFLEPNRKLHEVLQTKPLAYYSYHELEGNHTWKTWQPDVVTAVRKLFKKAGN
ncbi:enterochelin esterase-like enzyme [Scopulibacillus daqui]|uniref:Enterochelin esterase-like enzyme n=1 Tax=Scopulibacillus daqui TaxID=1469162 RepID=A0ABS2PVH9_9BACL|nr:alpha/beta hydrolase-fold protein [Scopulibacillus daqui]MBM7644058.1 enterochelin esterase-like enzyme [Scopulibacillus daqui]